MKNENAGWLWNYSSHPVRIYLLSHSVHSLYYSVFFHEFVPFSKKMHSFKKNVHYSLLIPTAIIHLPSPRKKNQKKKQTYFSDGNEVAIVRDTVPDQFHRLHGKVVAHDVQLVDLRHYYYFFYSIILRLNVVIHRIFVAEPARRENPGKSTWADRSPRRAWDWRKPAIQRSRLRLSNFLWLYPAKVKHTKKKQNVFNI